MDIQLWDRRLRVCHRKLLQRYVNENAQGVISFEVCRVMPRARFFSVGRGPSTTRELWVWSSYVRLCVLVQLHREGTW